jgi:deoxyribonuclease-2
MKTFILFNYPNHRFVFVLFLFFLLNVIGADQDRIVCRNEITGEELDWFTLYKLPKEHIRNFEAEELNNPYLDLGLAYTFITNKNQDKWQFSSLSINDTNSLPGKTLDIFYNMDDPNLGYLLYNDQADKVTIIKGHTKGIILFNSNSAIWIVHSIPKYPPKKSEKLYSIHSSQCIFGQSMLCMSFNFDQLDAIGRQLLYNFPQIYDFHIPDGLKDNKVLNNLIRATQGEHVKQPPWYNTELLTTVHGESLISFAKFTSYEDDLYSGLVAPSLKSSLLTETWNNGAGTLRSNCSQNLPYHVMNIEQLQFDFLNVKFSVHHDHSKWAVTTLKTENSYFITEVFDDENEIEKEDDYYESNSNDVNIACIGDINRQSEQ